MDNWKDETDLSWMSFMPEAHNIQNRTSGWTNSRNDRADEQQQQRGNWSSDWNRERDRGRRESLSGESDISAFQYEWREPEIVEEEEEEEEEVLRSRRKERGKEQMRKGSEDFDDGASSDGASSSAAPPAGARPTAYRWDGDRQPYSFSPRSLGRGFQTRRMSWMRSIEEVNVIKLPHGSKYARLEAGASVVFFCFLIAMAISIFLLYLSLGAAVRPHSSCGVDKVILNFTARRIRLRGGRYISFREQGVSADKAQHSLLVAHDLFSSRLAGIPGIKDSLLEEFQVRLVSYDRPGYGQSDPQPGRNYNSSAQDMADIADALGLGDKFWVVGFGVGGPHCWAAIHYIPERLAGVALFAPAGNFYADNMTKTDVEETWGTLTMRQKWMYSIARRFPALLPSVLQKTLIDNNPNPLQSMRASLCSKDRASMKQPEIFNSWNEDVREALQQQCAFPMAEELILLMDNWGFSLAYLPFTAREVKTLLQQVVGLFQAQEKPRIFTGPIHIWQGSDDQLVPATMNEYARRMVARNDVPKTYSSPVDFHLLKGEGHFSWFWFCDECHRSIFNSMFRPEPVATGTVGPKGFSTEEYEAILAAFGGPKGTSPSPIKEDPSEVKHSFALTLSRKTSDYTCDLHDTNVASGDPNDASTGLILYVPESCQPTKSVTSTSLLRTIEERLGGYIRDIGKHVRQ